MKKILFLLLLISGMAQAQGDHIRPVYKLVGLDVQYFFVAGYTNISSRYKWIATAVDSGLHVPQYNGVPTDRTGVWMADGAIACDTLNGHFYYRNGGVWIRVAKFSEIGSAAWSLTGNAGTTAGTNFVGTTDAVDLVLKTGGTERARWGSTGAYDAAFAGAANMVSSSTSPITIKATNGTDSSLLNVRGGTLAGQKIVEGRVRHGAYLSIMKAESQNAYLIVQDDVTSDVNLVRVNSGYIDISAASNTANSRIGLTDTLITFYPYHGEMYIDTLEAATDMTNKAVMVWDSVSTGWERIAASAISGAVPLSSLTAATAGNTINNANNSQIWQWNSLSGVGLTLQSNTTAAAGGSALLYLESTGANASSSITQSGIIITNNHSGTTSTNIGANINVAGATTNYGVLSAVSGSATTNIGGSFSATGATTNNAINIAAGALTLNGSAGTSGQVLTSAGANTLPTWTTPGAGSGGANVKFSSPVLKTTGDSLQLAVQIPTSRQGNDQSGYTSNLVWSQQTASSGSQWQDGTTAFYINDTLFAVGGYNNVTTTDSIYYSPDLGKTWAPYATKWPYALANIASIKARYPGDWNYIFGSTTDNTYKRTVSRFRTLQDIQTMTSTAEFGNILGYGVAQDDNGNLYLVGGQTDHTDTTTTVNDVWYSTAQSGGANWDKVQDNVSKLGGILTYSVQFRDGYLYIINSSNKFGSGGVSAYSNKVLKTPVSEIRDSTKWKYIENAPSNIGDRLYISTGLFKGMIWAAFGFPSGGGNDNGVAYLDKDDKWHTYYNSYTIDNTGTISTAHAADLIVAKGSLYRVMGNGTGGEVVRLSDTTFSTPIIARESVTAATRSIISEGVSGVKTYYGNGVIAATDANDMIKRVTTDAYNSYISQGQDGVLIGRLTTANSTLNTNVATGTGQQWYFKANGQLEISTSALTTTENLKVWGGGAILCKWTRRCVIMGE